MNTNANAIIVNAIQPRVIRITGAPQYRKTTNGKKLTGLYDFDLVCRGDHENLARVVGGENPLYEVLAPPLIDDICQ